MASTEILNNTENSSAPVESTAVDTKSVENIKIKTETVDESKDKTNYRQCNICFDDTKPDMLVNTPCGHIFCCDCFFGVDEAKLYVSLL